jgi:hypothetical protein
MINKFIVFDKRTGDYFPLAPIISRQFKKKISFIRIFPLRMDLYGSSQKAMGYFAFPGISKVMAVYFNIQLLHQQHTTCRQFDYLFSEG